jgi:hypothetical protein
VGLDRLRAARIVLGTYGTPHWQLLPHFGHSYRTTVSMIAGTKPDTTANPLFWTHKNAPRFP